MTKCPTCKKPVDESREKRSQWAPFCSERRKLVDLQKWLGGAYAIPGRPVEPGDGRGDVDTDP
jgi:endogenous inhibitor of DNA gyrase (YacG/DUF329 family)